MTGAWAPLREALDRAADRGRTIRAWLRDDDCVAPSPALDRLAGLCEAVGLPVLLAVIPEPAEAELVGWVADHAGFAPCQHGFSHANHARPGVRPIELGGTRKLDTLVDELALGRAKLRDLFGANLSDILVPPWNRIDPALEPALPALGFSALSTIAPTRAGGFLPRLDCDLDIMDWRAGRRGRLPVDVAAAAVEVIERQDALGLLTHHRVHDEGAWSVLGAMLEGLASHPAVRFAAAGPLQAS